MAGDVTLLYTVRNNYNIFRLALESALQYIPKDQYKEIIIVNDHSNDPKTLAYFDALKNDPSTKVRVVDVGEPRECGYYSDLGRGTNDIKNRTGKDILTSLGHGHSLTIGVNNVNTRYVMTLDSDTNILPKGKDLIPNMLNCFTLDEKILAVGQSSGRIDGINVTSEIFHYYKNKYDNNASGGFPNSCLMICDMESWTKYKLDKFANSGWAHTIYIKDLYKQGFKTCNYNIFKDGYALHLGYSTVRVTRKNFTATLGFVRDCTKYGSIRGSDGSINDWYGGYFSVGLNSKELFDFLNVEYDGFPYDQRKSVIHKIISKSLGGEMDYEPSPKPCTNPLIVDHNPKK